jgi:uncharacterized protein YcfL
MKLIMAIILSLLLVGCVSSQDQSQDYKVKDQEVHKQGESQEPTIMSPSDERYHQSSQY